MNWYPDAARRLGPASKDRGTMQPQGAVLHSAEGWEAGLYAELARSDRGSAWHASIMRDGRIVQHYSFTAILWHAGNAWANGNLVGVEHEGTAGQPLTDAQRETSVSLVRWLGEQYGWTPSRKEPVTLFEHREVSDTVTACPSGRIPWDAYTEERPMLTDEQRELLEYLEGDGASLPPSTKAGLLGSVGLPRNAKLADYEAQKPPEPG